MARLTLLLTLAALAPALAGPVSPAAEPVAAPTAGTRELTLLAVAEVRGTPEPCGCQADPVGDVARLIGLLHRFAPGTALLVDAGGLRYSALPQPPGARAQAELKADFLEEAWRKAGVVVGLGDDDLAGGKARVPAGRRLCSNLQGLSLSPPVIREVAGLRVGLFGVMAPGGDAPSGLAFSDPEEAAAKAVAGLKAQGAQVIVALAHLQRGEVRRLVQKVPGITVAVVGNLVGEGAAAERLGETLIVQPADEGRRAAVVTLTLDGAGRFSTRLIDGPEERRARLGRLDGRLATLDADLARMAADRDADPGFLAARRAERDRLAQERKALDGPPPPPPPAPHAAARLLPIQRTLTRDLETASRMARLDGQVGEANRRTGLRTPVPRAAPGEPTYLGNRGCASCHEDQAAQWKKTRHARAWEELVKVNKQWSHDCINCHVVGYGQRGGSAMSHVKGLTDVGCESCHGPGSLHAKKPASREMPVPRPPESLCKTCHTPEHSDTFQYEAYLRDILGPDHGPERREALGDGPTSHELRRNALEQARSPVPPTKLRP